MDYLLNGEADDATNAEFKVLNLIINGLPSKPDSYYTILEQLLRLMF